MRINIRWNIFWVAILFIAAVAAQPAWATLPTPNQPILVVQDSTSANPYQNFVPELLTTEGLNGFQTAQLTDLTSTFLTNYDVVILPHLTLTAAEATLFQNYVNAGGTLVGFRPDLATGQCIRRGSSGDDAAGSVAEDGHHHCLCALLRQRGDEVSRDGRPVFAQRRQRPGYPVQHLNSRQPLRRPLRSIAYGLGKAVLFSFDLTQSIVLMRQGNPAWAGYPNNHDGL